MSARINWYFALLRYGYSVHNGGFTDALLECQARALGLAANQWVTPEVCEPKARRPRRPGTGRAFAMLSQYDRQQLELISSRLHIEDPSLARSLRDGRPRPLPPPRRWPLVVLAVLAGLVFAAGIAVASFGFIFLGSVALWCIAWWNRRQTGKPARFKIWSKLFKRR